MTDPRLIDDVLALLAAYAPRDTANKRTGEQPGELSLTSLVDMLRHGERATEYRRWKNIRTSGFGDTILDELQAAGFTVNVRLAGRSVRTFITV